MLGNKIGLISCIILQLGLIFHSLLAVRSDLMLGQPPVEKLEVQCIVEYAKYCNGKLEGFKFNDGCRICKCEQSAVYCMEGPCKFYANFDDDDDMLDYCDAVNSHNANMYKLYASNMNRKFKLKYKIRPIDEARHAKFINRLSNGAYGFDHIDHAKSKLGMKELMRDRMKFNIPRRLEKKQQVKYINKFNEFIHYDYKNDAKDSEGITKARRFLSKHPRVEMSIKQLGVQTKAGDILTRVLSDLPRQKMAKNLNQKMTLNRKKNGGQFKGVPRQYAEILSQKYYRPWFEKEGMNARFVTTSSLIQDPKMNLYPLKNKSLNNWNIEIPQMLTHRKGLKSSYKYSSEVPEEMHIRIISPGRNKLSINKTSLMVPYDNANHVINNLSGNGSTKDALNDIKVLFKILNGSNIKFNESVSDMDIRNSIKLNSTKFTNPIFSTNNKIKHNDMNNDLLINKNINSLDLNYINPADKQVEEWNNVNQRVPTFYNTQNHNFKLKESLGQGFRNKYVQRNVFPHFKLMKFLPLNSARNSNKIKFIENTLHHPVKSYNLPGILAKSYFKPIYDKNSMDNRSRKRSKKIWFNEMIDDLKVYRSNRKLPNKFSSKIYQMPGLNREFLLSKADKIKKYLLRQEEILNRLMKYELSDTFPDLSKSNGVLDQSNLIDIRSSPDQSNSLSNIIAEFNHLLTDINKFMNDIDIIIDQIIKSHHYHQSHDHPIILSPIKYAEDESILNEMRRKRLRNLNNEVKRFEENTGSFLDIMKEREFH